MNPRILVSLCIASAAVAFVVAIVGARVLDKGNRTRFAVVDLTGVITKHQEKAVRMLADPGSDETAKKAAIVSAGEFGKRVNAEVLAISQECACVVLMREAVVAGQIEDLTPRLVARLSMQ